MDVENFVKQVTGFEEMAMKIADLASSNEESTINFLRDLLLVNNDDTFSKHIVPRLACRGLIQKGPRGIEAMVSAIPQAPRLTYSTSIIEALWYTAQGEQPPTTTLNDISLLPPLNEPPSSETVEVARQVFQELIIESQTKEDLFYELIEFIHTNSFITAAYGRNYKSFISTLFNIFTESSLKITSSIIADFEDLINNNYSEEVYQTFLAKHPVFIDPLASNIVPKQKLGTEYITDFVVQRLDGEYIIVEIEKASDEIFTKGNDFTAKFTHAFGQVIDFQEWIDVHGEYARSCIPGISSPRGLLIIGRRSSLTPEQSTKLKRYCINSRFIEVLTFDDLAIKAKNLYQNIYKQIKQN